jgi:hypothetical protein
LFFFIPRWANLRLKLKSSSVTATSFGYHRFSGDKSIHETDRSRLFEYSLRRSFCRVVDGEIIAGGRF